MNFRDGFWRYCVAFETRIEMNPVVKFLDLIHNCNLFLVSLSKSNKRIQRNGSNRWRKGNWTERKRSKRPRNSRRWIGRHLAFDVFQERIPSTLIKGQWMEGTKVSAWKRRGFQREEGKKKKGKKRGEKGENEEGTARYRKFESSHRGSGCCFIMRCTHLLQPPRTSWYLFLVRSLHTAVCVFKRTVCSMQSSRDRCIVVCRPSAKVARDYRSKTRQLIRISPYELNRKSFFIRLRPSFHSSMSCLSFFLSLSLALPSPRGRRYME